MIAGNTFLMGTSYWCRLVITSTSKTSVGAYVSQRTGLFNFLLMNFNVSNTNNYTLLFSYVTTVNNNPVLPLNPIQCIDRIACSNLGIPISVFVEMLLLLSQSFGRRVTSSGLPLLFFIFSPF